MFRYYIAQYHEVQYEIISILVNRLISLSMDNIINININTYRNRERRFLLSSYYGACTSIGNVHEIETEIT